MVDAWTEAWEEAEASVPASIFYYYTIELQHPAFVDDVEGPFSIRVCTGITEDFVLLTLEDSALFNPGEEVEFKGVMFWAEFPEFAEGKTPESAVVVDNVVDDIVPYLALAVQQQADLKMIYRVYRNDDTSEPCYGPVEFVIKNVKQTGTRLTGTATLDDLANKKFPSKVYTFNQFPGLMNG